MFLGLRTVIHPAPDLPAAKEWFTAALGVEPYFDEPFYVGYSVGGYELGLDPDADVTEGAVAYWGVPEADAAMARLLDAGASERLAVREVGDGIRVGRVTLPGGTGTLGIIENPHFAVGDPPPGLPAGPGR